ncbi:hypothetical protein L596_016322 [Steinernema carpocapsae]|uniref:Uncharacterized protein n=1 Tax=Steinernema carpocapsae TaxID=34508 RepID=A0A4U5NIU3_STECR|nr:hypothetical protein L596_016322 [Steinernema carpocapsae]
MSKPKTGQRSASSTRPPLPPPRATAPPPAPRELRTISARIDLQAVAPPATTSTLLRAVRKASAPRSRLPLPTSSSAPPTSDKPPATSSMKPSRTGARVGATMSSEVR